MSATTATVSGLSGRYATALFELAVKEGKLDAISSDVDKLSQMLAESEDLRRFIASPRASREALEKALLALADDAGFDPLTRNFLGVLAENRRAAALSEIIADFRKLGAAHRGEVSADVTVARPLGDDQKEALRHKLRQNIGRDVDMNITVDPNILAGLVVQVGSRQIDASLRSKLNRLRLSMKGAG